MHGDCGTGIAGLQPGELSCMQMWVQGWSVLSMRRMCLPSLGCRPLGLGTMVEQMHRETSQPPQSSLVPFIHCAPESCNSAKGESKYERF